MELLTHYSNPALPLFDLGKLLEPCPRARPVDLPRRAHKRPKQLSAETRSALVDDYRAGIPTTQLTQKYGLGKGSVLRIIRDSGAPMRRQPMTEADIEQATQRYAAGDSLAKIGKELDRDASVIRDALLARGVQMRSPNKRGPRSGRAQAALSNRMP